MAISLNQAMAQLAKVERQRMTAQKRALAEKETREEAMEYAMLSAIRFAAAGAAGAADALIEDTFVGLTPAELAGAALAALSFAGVLGKGTKPARAAAEGSLCYALGRRAFAWVGGTTEKQLPAAPEVSGAIGATRTNDLIDQMNEALEDAGANDLAA